MKNKFPDTGEHSLSLLRDLLVAFNGFRYAVLGTSWTRRTSAISPSCSPVILTTSFAWLLCLVCSLSIFLAPALWNGFPIVFHDTAGYAGSVLEMRLMPGRSFFYGLFLWGLSLGWWSFWGPVLAQSCFTLWVIHLMLRCHDLPPGPLATAIFCVGLGISTSISWYTAQLMPDILAPLVVLTLWLLGFCQGRLDRRERTGLEALALLGLLSHMSCMALAIGLAAIVLAAWILGRRQGRWPSGCSLSPVGVVAASLILMPMVHLGVMGTATFTPGGPVFVFGSLVQDGIAQRWLGDHCPAPGIRLCGLQDRLPTTADEFLWAGDSPFREIGEWEGATPELSYLVKECFKAYPGAIILNAIRATARQTAMVATGDGLNEFYGATRGVFAESFPGTVRPFNAAFQQQGRITRSFFDAFNRVHVPVAYMSMVGLILAIAWGFHSRRHDLAGLASFTMLALLGNAFICGALSNPHHRYQSRILWLAPLVVGMTIVCWWQLRMKNFKSAGTATGRPLNPDLR